MSKISKLSILSKNFDVITIKYKNLIDNINNSQIESKLEKIECEKQKNVKNIKKKKKKTWFYAYFYYILFNEILVKKNKNNLFINNYKN